ncbi:MAG: helix-turn-helix transcriptional regulator [Planctomycetota bacterium]|nr:helix-turn-helix transcriptional regulator [Planctomycetota bacterium]
MIRFIPQQFHLGLRAIGKRTGFTGNSVFSAPLAMQALGDHYDAKWATLIHADLHGQMAVGILARLMADGPKQFSASYSQCQAMDPNDLDITIDEFQMPYPAMVVVLDGQYCKQWHIPTTFAVGYSKELHSLGMLRGNMWGDASGVFDTLLMTSLERTIADVLSIRLPPLLSPIGKPTFTVAEVQRAQSIVLGCMMALASQPVSCDRYANPKRAKRLRRKHSLEILSELRVVESVPEGEANVRQQDKQTPVEMERRTVTITEVVDDTFGSDDEFGSVTVRPVSEVDRELQLCIPRCSDAPIVALPVEPVEEVAVEEHLTGNVRSDGRPAQTIWQMKADEWMEEYSRHGKRARPPAERTMENVTPVVRAFVDRLGNDPLNEAVLQKYRQDLLNEPLANSTKDSHLNITCTFLEWCRETGYLGKMKPRDILKPFQQPPPDVSVSRSPVPHGGTTPVRVKGMATERRPRKPQVTGRNIAHLRGRTGLDIQTFAELLGVSVNTVYHYERQAVRFRPRGKHQPRIDALLRMTDSELAKEVAGFKGKMEKQGPDNATDGDAP